MLELISLSAGQMLIGKTNKVPFVNWSSGTATSANQWIFHLLQENAVTIDCSECKILYMMP